MQIAQTNPQLYNQLLDNRLPLHDLLLVHHAYELLATLYPGHFQADGKPFVAHGVGVASILAQLNEPAEILAVGLLHNVYGNADFGDGREGIVTASRRSVVRAAVGERIDELLIRFRELRVGPQNVEEVRRALPGRSDTERRLICVDLADYLEKYVDVGILYWAATGWSASELIGDELIAIAHDLGRPRLAAMLSEAFSTAASRRDQVPAALRPSDGRLQLTLVVPRSCRRKFAVSLRMAVRSLRDRVRLRTRLRRFWNLSQRPRRS